MPYSTKDRHAALQQMRQQLQQHASIDIQIQILDAFIAAEKQILAALIPPESRSLVLDNAQIKLNTLLFIHRNAVEVEQELSLDPSYDSEEDEDYVYGSGMDISEDSSQESTTLGTSSDEESVKQLGMQSSMPQSRITISSTINSLFSALRRGNNNYEPWDMPAEPPLRDLFRN